MRIGWYVNGSGAGTASVRLRALTPITHLSARGYEAALWTRDAAPFDVVIFSKVYDDRALEAALAMQAKGTRVVLDLCDNHWFGENCNPEIAARARQLARMIDCADRLTVSTFTLADQLIKRFPIASDRIDVIPDPVIEPQARPMGLRGRFELWHLRRWLRRHVGTQNLIWFGNHGANHVRSGMDDLRLVRTVIERGNSDFTLTIVSNSRTKFNRIFADWKVPLFYLPWRLDTIDSVMAMHDAAIIPITQSDFTIAKTMNRPATALMAGLDVFADRIPSYDELAPFIVLDNWGALAQLPFMAANRAERSAKARDWLKARYAPTIIADAWAEVAARSLR